MKNEAHDIKASILGVVLAWSVFDVGIYLTYSESFRYRMANGASTFETIASIAYLAALLITIFYNCRKGYRGHLSLWVSLGIVSLAFGAAGYVIEQSVYLNGDDPEKTEGGIIFFVAVGLGLVTALICSLSIIGNHLLDAHASKGPQK